MTATIGTALGDRYRIERELGAGGMATVYLARDLKHNRNVAVKVLLPELAAVVGAERFLHEIEVTANLEHPHILPLFDSGQAEGLLYYVMPYVEGESLRDRLKREGQLPVEDAVAITGDVAAALTYAHARGVIHRDIKPENIMLDDGEARVADFGIALAVARTEQDRLTATGLSIGTPSYMSPEQIGGEATIDGRSDEYSLACVLYEMLVGEPPFTGPNAQALVAKVLTDAPPSVRTRRPDVLGAIDAAIDTALAKHPDDRFESPREFFESCQIAPQPQKSRILARVLTVLVSGVAIAAAVVGWQMIQVSNARASLLEIADLAEAGEFAEAYELATRAERFLSTDSALVALMAQVSDYISVTSEPPGARVFLRPYTDDADVGDGVEVGFTPLEGYRVPRIDHRVTVALDGHVPAVRIASSDWKRFDAGEQQRGLDWAIVLRPVEEQPDDMVFVPGGSYQMASPDAAPGMIANLDDFLIDKFEVTNEAFLSFVEAGGYADDRLWDTIPTDVVGTLVDRTGLPGPRGWVRQRFPEDEGQHPVTGVTWYEALAYCRFAGKRLPTVYEWEKTARDGGRSRLGVLMPWGFVGAAGPGQTRANFNSSGTRPVGTFPFGISPFGAHDMAGNVKEWMANPMGDGFVVTGASWEDPSYIYTEYGAQPATRASPALGFRCARTLGAGMGDQGAGRVEMDERTPVYTPVDRSQFESILGHYQYDRRPANERVTDRVRTPGWTRERLWIDGVAGDSVLLYFFAPTAILPPYQTMVYVPSAGAFCCEAVGEQVESVVGPAIQRGRAAMAAVMKGMVERPWLNHELPEPNTVQFRDEMVLRATELRLAIDYLETRGDVNMNRLAYVGVSWGAGSRLGFAAIDDRYDAVVLVGGGIDERVKPTLPEADHVNFAPYIDVPKLLLNGRNDEEHPWYTRALPLWNLLQEPKELVLVDGGGHMLPLEARIAAINDFLDEILGPVQGRR